MSPASFCMNSNLVNNDIVKQQVQKIDNTYAALHSLISACEKGSVADLNQKLRTFEQTLVEVQRVRASLSNLKDKKDTQIDKIADLRRQIVLKDELIDSFGRVDKNETAKEVEVKKNATNISCNLCGSLILRAGDSKWIEGEERSIPLARQQKGVSTQMEKLEGWWTVVDMFTFENVGFTNSMDGMRYLTCADCDYGPIGIVIQGGLHIVAPSRVKME